MALFLFAVTVLWASAAQADDIFGTWIRDDKAARVTIANCGSAICATNVWIRDPAAQREKVGDKLVFRIKQEGQSWRGTGNDPQRNMNFNATLEAKGATMRTSGCMFGGLACRSTNWTRE